MYQLIPNDTVDKLLGINVQFGRGGPWSGQVLTSTGRHWADDAMMLDSWGMSTCQICGRHTEGLFHDTLVGHDTASTQGIMCNICQAFAIRTMFRRQWYYFDNFVQHGNFLPLLVTLDPLANDLIPDVAMEGNLFGIHWLGGTMRALYPFGIDLITRLISNGHRLFAQSAFQMRMVRFNEWPNWPGRTGLSNGWLIWDMANIGFQQVRDAARYVEDMRLRWNHMLKDNPYAYSINNGQRLLQQMVSVASGLTNGDVEGLLVAARALKLVQDFNKEEWQKKLNEALTPFGDPAKVLGPLKVLRAGK